MPLLIVTQDNETGRFEAKRDGDCGMCIVGRGASVAEAVGLWAIYSGELQVKAEPPALLREFEIKTPYQELDFNPNDRR